MRKIHYLLKKIETTVNLTYLTYLRNEEKLMYNFYYSKISHQLARTTRDKHLSSHARFVKKHANTSAIFDRDSWSFFFWKRRFIEEYQVLTWFYLVWIVFSFLKGIKMTLMTLFGCILIAFGPASVLFLVAVARDHFHVVIMISRYVINAKVSIKIIF